MNRRAQTNHLLYQARLMLDQAEAGGAAILAQTAEEAAVVFMHRAFRASLVEVGEYYGVTLRADEPLTVMMERLGRDRPDGWEFRYVTESLRQPGHWMRQLRMGAENWALTAESKPTDVSSDRMIEVVAEESGEDTNYYRNWLEELQKWVDQIREQGDFS